MQWLDGLRMNDLRTAFGLLTVLPVRSGGRYRAAGDGGTNPLDMTNSADNSFDVLGPGVALEGAGP